MFRMIRVVVLFVLVSVLSACATTSPVKSEDQEQKVRTAKINAQLGIAYLERHNIQRSKQKLLLALEQAPTIPETWYSMAYFLEATGNKDDASIYYQKAVSLAPTRGDAQNNYGTFLCRNGEYRESIDHFMLAVKDPTYLDPADAYENAGLCANKIPDKKLAANYFSQALQQDPSRSVSQKKLAELNKYLAMNGEQSYPETKALAVQNAVPNVVAEADLEIVPQEVQPVAPKRIAYNSLRHRQDEDESEEESGLVKIPELLKTRSAVVAQAEPVAKPRPPIEAPKSKRLAAAKPAAATQLKKAVTHQFHVEHVALKPLPKQSKTSKTVAKLKSKRVQKIAMTKPAKPVKVARSSKAVKVATLSKSKPKKVKVARAVPTKKPVLAKKNRPTKGAVTV